ncbi:MAG: ribosome biogenesis GTPase Der [Gammaproteobacteria bacterium]|nr:ribosome biogenesis GTPase Der [Gammaproteobacteria bacterium]MYD76257.1 ribosome biogenesis GTPase Der [Gammaproteobacteria bacterium]MYJ52316.1 ribosome biogenesis GTPase Der [Gammaproteobacteria bacterium]
MLPVIALIGRPNVGKSTLFNRLTRSRDALVDDRPGVTRDRLYGQCRLGRHPFLVVDSGGLDLDGDDFASQVHGQVEQLLIESDTVLFVVDALDGVLMHDREIAQWLRASGATVRLIVNKTEGVDPDIATSEFEELGLGKPVPVSARRGSGIGKLLESLFEGEPDVPVEGADTARIPAIAIVGRPNVGKSTLLNRLSGEKRAIVSSLPGTTRDCVRTPVRIDGNEYDLVDTAGIRKKAVVRDRIEKFSVVKTLQAIEASDAVLLVLDARTGIESQDVAIAGMIHELGRSLAVVLNKWDGLDRSWKNRMIRDAGERLSFLPDCEHVAISALYGSNLDDVLPAAIRARESAMIKIPTSSLNRVLQEAISSTPPPAYRNRQIKLKFAHQAGSNPPLVVIHGNQADKLPESYRRYLSRFLARAYRLRGTPVRIIMRVGDNPFAGGKSAERGSGRRR